MAIVVDSVRYSHLCQLCSAEFEVPLDHDDIISERWLLKEQPSSERFPPKSWPTVDCVELHSKLHDK